MPVTGIGGFFYRARDPATLQAWYAEHLGVVVDFAAPWVQQPGPTMVMPFAHDTDYFAADKQWMLNLRVSGLDGLIADLRTAGIDVVTDPAWDSPETGCFARIHDPEGNPLELWEPPAE